MVTIELFTFTEKFVSNPTELYADVSLEITKPFYYESCLIFTFLFATWS